LPIAKTQISKVMVLDSYFEPPKSHCSNLASVSSMMILGVFWGVIGSVGWDLKIQSFPSRDEGFGSLKLFLSTSAMNQLTFLPKSAFVTVTIARCPTAQLKLSLPDGFKQQPSPTAQLARRLSFFGGDLIVNYYVVRL